MECILVALPGGAAPITAALRSSSVALYGTVEKRGSLVEAWKPRRWTRDASQNPPRGDANRTANALARNAREGVWLVIPGPEVEVSPRELEALVATLGDTSAMKFESVVLRICDNGSAISTFTAKRPIVAMDGCDAIQCFAAGARNILSDEISLEFRGVSKSDSFLNVPLLASIVSIRIGSCDIDAACLRHITEIKSLHTFDLHFSARLRIGTTECDDFCRRLAELRALTSLTLYLGEHLSEAGLRHLSSIPSLQSLELNYCRNVTDEGVRLIVSHPKLTSLDITHMPMVTDTGLRHIGANQRLRSLALNGLPVGDEGLRSLSSLRTLTYLKIISAAPVTPEGFRAVKDLSRLKTFEIQEQWTGVRAFLNDGVNLRIV